MSYYPHIKALIVVGGDKLKMSVVICCTSFRQEKERERKEREKRGTE